MPQPTQHPPTSPSPNPPTPTRPPIHGLSLTPLTQCTHYSTPLDIIAIQHYCCKAFFACLKCHEACASPRHDNIPWPKDEWDAKAVLCGRCGKLLQIDEYMGCGSRCTGCGGKFNSGCKAHWGVYFGA